MGEPVVHRGGDVQRIELRRVDVGLMHEVLDFHQLRGRGVERRHPRGREPDEARRGRRVAQPLAHLGQDPGLVVEVTAQTIDEGSSGDAHLRASSSGPGERLTSVWCGSKLTKGVLVLRSVVREGCSYGI